MKTCKRCGEDKEVGDFYKYASYRDGMCKLCRNKYAKSWRQIRYSDKEYYLRLSLVEEGKNLCRICNYVKPLDQFIKSKKHRTGYNSRCHTCRRLEYKIAHLKQDYNLDYLEYLQMINNQEKSCKICKQTLVLKYNKTCVDHCHSTGNVRGLLCNTCNRVLGLFSEDISRFYSAIKYLKSNIAHVKSLELQGSPEMDNLQPSSVKVSNTVTEKVHRLIGEDETTNKPNTSEGQRLNYTPSKRGNNKR